MSKLTRFDDYTDSLAALTSDQTQPLPQQTQQLFDEAKAFVHLIYQELGKDKEISQRLQHIQAELASTGTYSHTLEELEYGSKVAWRNNSQCVGKFYWQQLQLRDLRQAKTAEEVFQGCVEHLRHATNNGRTRLLLTIFPPQHPGNAGIRIWNSQLVRYAAYERSDGSIIGDPPNLELTKIIQHLGWQGEGSSFDLLPLVIQMPDERPQVFALPKDAVLEVPITHPEYEGFADLGLKWHSHPAISGSRLELGGVSYTAAPFSAWYTCTEIGARNFSDANRYNMLPQVASVLGLDTRSDRNLWKDRALLELTRAVLYSFEARKVSILDHHAVSRQFIIHEEREKKAGRSVSAQWDMIIPPMSASTTPVFERRYETTDLKPNFYRQDDPWMKLETETLETKTLDTEVTAEGKCPFH